MDANSLPITVLGAGGWIGAAIVADLQRQERHVIPLDRAGLPQWLASREPQGPVIYAIGLTADFRQRPHATAEAHIGLLSKVLQRPGLQQLCFSLLPVSIPGVDLLETALAMPTAIPDLYNLSKLMVSHWCSKIRDQG